MKLHQLAKLCAWSLGMFVLCTTPACAENTTSPPNTSQQQPTRQGILQELFKADVVYLGETHSRPEDHQAQLDILSALYQENPKIAVAMEMFQRPFQDALDRYLKGEITEAQLIEQTEYEQRWGFPWEYYAPILRFAQAHQLPVLALNTPTEVTRQVARRGLESLSASDRQFIPPLAEIDTDDPDYRQMIRKFYDLHHQQGHGNSTSFDRFFTAQVLWDETMAEKIAQFHQANPDYQVVVLVGQGHVVYDYGIPSRVARRLNAEQLVQRTVLLGESPDVEASGEKAIADFFWPH
jgi:uncharacterized iron-regulated protein